MEKLYKNSRIWMILVILSLMSFKSSNTGKLVIEVLGARNSKGSILIAVFDQKSAKYFPEGGEHAYKRFKTPIHNGKAMISINNLPYGTYAVTLMHDEDGDRKMDKNAFGIPKEGYAFSTNFRPRFSAPDFGDTDFKFASSYKKIQLKLIY